MSATEPQADAGTISPRRRRRFLVACLVVVGTMVVLSRMLPAALTILYG